MPDNDDRKQKAWKRACPIEGTDPERFPLDQFRQDRHKMPMVFSMYRCKAAGEWDLVCNAKGERAFFVHGLAKSDRENLRRNDVRALRPLADEMLGLDVLGLGAMLANGTIGEMSCDGQAV